MSELLQVIRETWTWCAHVAGAAESLRTPGLHPGDLSMCGAMLTGRSEQSIHEERVVVVERLVATRRAALASAGNTRLLESAAGRLLAFELASSFFDGSSADVSGGFFDEEDLPPWDTWIGYRLDSAGSHVLLSWVPERFVEPAHRGVEVHMSEAYSWTSQDDALAMKLVPGVRLPDPYQSS